ncbi:hypothetical protein FXO37_30359 [Capsicum annuum]|nr:hypothetical protein FXO37_30359 [Capsicum annuum]
MAKAITEFELNIWRIMLMRLENEFLYIRLLSHSLVMRMSSIGSYVLLFLEVDLMLLPTKTIDFAHIKDYINLIALSSGIVLDLAPWEAKGDASTAHLTDIPDADADTTVALI